MGDPSCGDRGNGNVVRTNTLAFNGVQGQPSIKTGGNTAAEGEFRMRAFETDDKAVPYLAAGATPPGAPALVSGPRPGPPGAASPAVWVATSP